MKGAGLLPALALLCAGLASAQTETQHAFDGSIKLARRLDVVLHARVRTQPGLLGFYQGRLGPIFEYSVNGRFTLIAGYYYARQENSEADYIAGHRWFGGGEVSLWSSKASEADARALAEWFDLAQGSDYSRYRFRFRVSGKQKAAPYGSVENFLDARGWRSTRYAAGLRVGAGARVTMDFGYFLEPRRADVGRTRHMFMTGVHWRFGGRRLPGSDL
ncbi:MAG: DUF2490 domain-containing protein [Bryobacteraceae bacterium]